MKKLLALVLALVMTLGLATVGSNAAFKDDADIQYKEAVDVMSAIGVLAGMEDGNFQPTGNLTREQGAKIIAYMLLGPSAADALTASKAPFADVAADRWSAGVIQYCVAEGIISGVGDNKFDPTGALTGYAFAKMALVALGYRADMEGLTGDDWALNTASLVRKLDLTNGISAFAGSQTLNRQTAAQIGLNTLKATEVYYGTDISSHSDGTSSVSTNVRSTNVTNNTTSYFGAADGRMQLVEDVFPKLKLTTTTDSFGNPVDKWTLGAAVVSESTVRTPVATFTTDLTGTNNTTVADALKGYTYTGASEHQTNGAAAVLFSGTKATDDATVKGLTAQGRTVKVYANDNNVIDYVAAFDTYLAKITAKDTVNKKVTVTVLTGGATNATILTSEKNDANKDFYEELYALSKGDYVLLNASNVTAGSLAILDVVGKPTETTGTYSKVASGTYTVGGTGYKANVVGKALAAMALNTNYDLVLDQYDNIIYWTAATTTKNYALVLDVSTSGNVKDGVTYYAQLLLADGTKIWADVSKVGSTKTSSSSYSPAAFATDLPKPVNGTSVTFVTYKEVDGQYELSKLSSNDGSAAAYADYTGAAGTVDVEKNAKTYSDGTQTYTLSSSTVFLFYNGDTKTFNVYNGISNLPSKTEVTRNQVYLLQTESTTSGVIRMFVALGGVNAKSSDVVYVYDTKPVDEVYNSDVATSKKVVTLNAVVNGEITTITASGDETDLYTSSAGVQKLTDTIVYADGSYISSAAAATVVNKDLNSISSETYSTASKVVKIVDGASEYMKAKIDGGILTFANNAASKAISFITVSECPILIVDKNGGTDMTGSVSGIEFEDAYAEFGANTANNTEIYVKTNSDGYASWVLIVMP